MYAKKFLRTFKPYQKKYRVSSSGGFWTEIDSPLTIELIDEAIKGKKKISFFTRYNLNYLGLDLDCHDVSDIWNNEEGYRVLLNKYSELRRVIGVYPSLLFKSDRGLHLYYFFNYRVNSEILVYKTKKKFKESLDKLTVEILPTTTTTLKIDTSKSQLDPLTLKPIKYDLVNYSIYSAHELFNEDLFKSNTLLNSIRKNEISQSKTVFNSLKFEKLEKALSKENFIGNTNRLIFQSSLLPSYFHAGLSIDDSVYRIQKLLFQNNYNGELLNKKDRLEKRIASSFRKFERNKQNYIFIGKDENKELSITDTILIENLCNSSPFNKRRNGHFRIFLENLFRWINYHDSMTFSQKEFWSFFYRNYRLHRKNNYYPIPFKLFQKWNYRCSEFIEYLKEKNILKLRINHYFEFAGSCNNQCNYYEIGRITEMKKAYDIELIELIKNSGLGVSKVSKLLGVNKRTIHFWLSGERSIPKKDIERYTLILSVNRSA